jgi:hypothetical protein
MQMLRVENLERVRQIPRIPAVDQVWAVSDSEKRCMEHELARGHEVGIPRPAHCGPRNF